MDEDLAHNIYVVAPWSDEDWTTWLFKAFRENDHRPLRISSRSTVTSELEQLFAYASEDARQRMRRGLVDALRMWDEEFHGFEVLSALAWTAAKIRVVYAIPTLIKILLDNRERMTWGSPFFDTADIVLGVLAGFAVDEPDKRIESAFDALFHDPQVAPQFSSLLALGISICNSERFVEAFDRFVEQAAVAGSYFVGVDVITQFADHLTAKRIKDNLDLLSPAAQEYAWAAGVKAKIFKKSEITGLTKDGFDRPLIRPAPFRKASHADLYESATARLRQASRAYRESHRSVLDGVYAKARSRRRLSRGRE